MSNYAVVINGIVDNLIRYDGGWEVVPEGWNPVKVNPGESVQIGWGYDPNLNPRFFPV